MKRPKHLILMVTTAITIFAAGFVSGAIYMTPEPGLYQLTRVDCSGYENTVECGGDETMRALMDRNAAIECEASRGLLDLMQKCRASAIDGFGQEAQCNDGSTWVPRNIDHLDPQLFMMTTEVERQCGPSAELESTE